MSATLTLSWSDDTGFGTVAWVGGSMSLAMRPACIPADIAALTLGVNGYTATAHDGSMLELTAGELAAVEAFCAEAQQAHGGLNLVHGVDADGNYMGLVQPGASVQQALSAPPVPGCRWVGGSWVRTLSLDEEKAAAWDAIDKAAGAARVRYITDVPGQQATYMAKAEQARAYLAELSAGGTAKPGPFVEAEASATGLSASDAAKEIVTVADAWENVLGPTIERERRAGSLAVSAAVDVAAVRAALLSAVAALGMI